jgi:nucleoside-diphosphate-sugar epimerase
MNILVTGGAGYVGTRLVQELLRLDHNVTILDTMLYGNFTHKVRPSNELKAIKGDIRDRATIQEALRDIQVVYHLAGISNDPTGNLNPQLTVNVNKKGTKLLLEECKKAKIIRFIYASSSSVFGIQTGENITEKCTPAPLTIYSKTKLEAEEMVLRQNNFTSVAIRPATICGVSPRQRFDLIVNALCGSAFFDDRITVFGGTQRRPNLTMSDMINIYILLLTIPQEKIHQEVFNAGWENSTISGLAKKVNKHFNIPINLEPSDDNRDYHICSNKIEQVLEYKPIDTIDGAIQDLRKALLQGFFSYYKRPEYNNIIMLKG